jgi:choline-sulfatase
LIVVALSGCLAAFGGWRFAKASAPVNGPIVLISIDALRPDHLGAYGDAGARTPAIDRLAEDGIVFERAYAHVPQTLPAHVSLLTGRLPFETGVRDVAGYVLPDSVRTIAEMLRDRGYATGGIVSTFLLRKETGIGRGFAFFDADLPPADGKAVDAGLVRDGADSEKVAEHWLNSIGTSRAFLFLHLAEPHAPYTAAENIGESSPYDVEITYADEIVGRLVQYLKERQLYDRATILLVSDHGEALGEHGETGHGLLAYEESLRVPLIVKQPGGDGARRRVSTPVQQIDVVPTILDLAKAPGASGLRGRSLTPLFNGGSIGATQIYAESMYGQYRFGWASVKSVIDGNYQLVSTGSRNELFDLTTPPSERQDISAAKPDVLAAARKRLDDFSTHVSPLKPTPVTGTDRERYEALGYLGVPAAAPLDESAQPEPADAVAFVSDYRSAVTLAGSGRWREALDAFRALTREQPQMADVWLHLARTAARSERQEVAVDAYRQALEIEPDNVAAHLGSAASNFRARRLDDTVTHAEWVILSPSTDPVQKAEAHELLSRAALLKRNLDVARSEAEAAETADPQRPVRAFVEGRIALDQGRYSDAVDAFEQALAAAEKAGRPPLTDLRVYAADALVRVDRAGDAERLLNDELRTFPANARARAALQALNRGTGRSRAVAPTQH